MAFSDSTSYTGQQNISTFNGNILIDSARGEIAIRETGSPIKRTVLDKLGLTTSDPDGTQRLRAGIAQSDGRTIIATTKTGVDLRSGGI